MALCSHQHEAFVFTNTEFVRKEGEKTQKCTERKKKDGERSNRWWIWLGLHRAVLCLEGAQTLKHLSHIEESQSWKGRCL